MMLSDAIKTIYPDLIDFDFSSSGTIVLQNDNDDKGDYIKSWNNSTYTQPTEEQLIAAGWVKHGN